MFEELHCFSRSRNDVTGIWSRKVSTLLWCWHWWLWDCTLGWCSVVLTYLSSSARPLKSVNAGWLCSSDGFCPWSLMSPLLQASLTSHQAMSGCLPAPHHGALQFRNRGPSPGDSQMGHLRPKSCFQEKCLHRCEMKRQFMRAWSPWGAHTVQVPWQMEEPHVHHTSGTRQTEGVPGWQCEFVLFFPAFAFLASVSKQSFWGQRQFCSMGWNLLGGLFDCFGREKHPSIHFPLQSKLKCFLVPPIGVMRKHSHCQSPLQWQSSPSWQGQACCFANLPACPVMVVSYGRLSSYKGIAAVLIMFLVALFQRPPALQIGLEDCWSVAYSEAGWLCPVVQMWLLQRLSRAGRAGQSDPELAVPSRGTWRGYPKLTSLGVCLMCNG